MNYYEFISDNKWFSLKLPKNWSEYDDEENTYAFFNTEIWGGNLRITHFRWTNLDSEIDETSKTIKSILREHSTAVVVNFKTWEAAFYSEETADENIAYFWFTGTKNDLFVYSFTFDKSFFGESWHNDELIVVNNMLKSVEVVG